MLAAMEVDGEGTSQYNKKTMLDENGQYPVWMNKRRVKKLRQKRTTDKKKKESGKKRKNAKW